MPASLPEACLWRKYWDLQGRVTAQNPGKGRKDRKKPPLSWVLGGSKPGPALSAPPHPSLWALQTNTSLHILQPPAGRPRGGNTRVT